jgi:hypothetical protein
MLTRLLGVHPLVHLVATRLHDGHASLPDLVGHQPEGGPETIKAQIRKTASELGLRRWIG